MLSYHGYGSTVRFFSSLSTLCSLVGSVETWGHHFLKYSGVACHKLNRFNSRVFTLDFTWNCCRLLEAKKFWRNPGQFKWVTRETRYCISIAELLKRNLMRQVAELFQRPRTMLKILYFSGDHHFFQKWQRINFLYHRGRELSIYGELSIYCWGGIIWDRKDTFSKIINRRGHRGASDQGTWTMCVKGWHCTIKKCLLGLSKKNKWPFL